MVVRFIEELLEKQGDEGTKAEQAEDADLEFMAVASKSMGMLLILRKFLQALYKLSHE